MPGSNQKPDAHDLLVCDDLALRDGSEARPWLSLEAGGGVDGEPIPRGAQLGCGPGGLTLITVCLGTSPSLVLQRQQKDHLDGV